MSYPKSESLYRIKARVCKWRGHKWGEWRTDDEAMGWRWRACTFCGYAEFDTKKGPRMGKRLTGDEPTAPLPALGVAPLQCGASITSGVDRLLASAADKSSSVGTTNGLSQIIEAAVAAERERVIGVLIRTPPSIYTTTERRGILGMERPVASYEALKELLAPRAEGTNE